MDQWNHVTSSTIEAVVYDGPTRTMKIRFKSGKVYNYHDVPPEMHDELLSAPSAGQHFHNQVRDQFRSTRG